MKSTILLTDPSDSTVRLRRLALRIRAFSTRRHFWSPEDDKLLGTASDTEIAARLDRHLATVCIRRNKLGIPNFCRHRWRPEDDQLLGSISDEEASRRLGCNLSAVQARRRVLRIRPQNPDPASGKPTLQPQRTTLI